MYEYDESWEFELKTLKFDFYSEEWLDFILNWRSGKDFCDLGEAKEGQRKNKK